jgi:hypothetical protein
MVPACDYFLTALRSSVSLIHLIFLAFMLVGIASVSAQRIIGSSEWSLPTLCSRALDTTADVEASFHFRSPSISCSIPMLCLTRISPGLSLISTSFFLKLAKRNKLARLDPLPLVVPEEACDTNVPSRNAKIFPKNGLSAGTDRATRVEPISATSMVSRLL